MNNKSRKQQEKKKTKSEQKRVQYVEINSTNSDSSYTKYSI